MDPDFSTMVEKLPERGRRAASTPWGTRMTVARPIVEASIGGIMALGVLVNNALDMIQQTTALGPSAIFGGDAAWQWGLVIAAAGLVWRAGALVMRVEKTLENFAEVQARHAEMQAKTDADMMSRIAAHEAKWRDWEPVLIEWRVRLRFDRDREVG